MNIFQVQSAKLSQCLATYRSKHQFIFLRILATIHPCTGRCSTRRHQSGSGSWAELVSINVYSALSQSEWWVAGDHRPPNPHKEYRKQRYLTPIPQSYFKSSVRNKINKRFLVYIKSQSIKFALSFMY